MIDSRETNGADVAGGGHPEAMKTPDFVERASAPVVVARAVAFPVQLAPGQGRASWRAWWRDPPFGFARARSSRWDHWR